MSRDSNPMACTMIRFPGVRPHLIGKLIQMVWAEGLEPCISKTALLVSYGLCFRVRLHNPQTRNWRFGRVFENARLTNSSRSHSGSGCRNRTYYLLVMSQVSYHFSDPQLVALGQFRI